jgi:hypothetical protein
MPHDIYQRIADVTTVPSELLDYQQWLAQHRAQVPGRDYLFSQHRARFEPRSGDVVVALPGLKLNDKGRTLRLQCAQPQLDLELPAMARRDAERILASIDGRRSLAEVLWDCGVDQERLGKFLRLAFGTALFAPKAVEELEQRLPGLQIVRYPSAPYAIERAYWCNMVDVRERTLARLDVLADRSAFVDALRELHVIAVMGRALSSFYKPASPASDLAVAPGNLLLAEPHLLPRSRYDVFLDGPRVNASMLGSEKWQKAIYKDVGDDHAADERIEHQHEGVPWGRVIEARADKDDRPRAWFLPPRPILDAHFDGLHGPWLRAMQSAEPDEVVQACALFHLAFVRLHPFHCANQSLAMNMINAMLTRVLGAGIPHLMLDHLALRMDRSAYVRVFRRAVQSWIVPEPDPVKRFTALMERKTRSNALIGEVAVAEPDAAIAKDPDAARWALMRG